MCSIAYPVKSAVVTSYSTLRWVTTTPFGLPVVPDV